MLYNRFFKGAGNAYECIMQIAVKKWNLNQKLSSFIVWKGRRNGKRNGKALLPIFVFVVLYLGLGILFEYGLRIEMGFYKIPVVVIFLIALLVACLQNRSLQLNDKLAVMGTGISDPNIITMILIFMLAGIFCRVSADPPQTALPTSFSL